MSAGVIPAFWGGLQPLCVSFLLLMSAQPSKRERVDIISTILGFAADGVTSRTHLMYRSNLDSRALKKYMALLTEKGLLSSEEDEDNHNSYHLTEKGRDFLQRYRDLEGLLV